MLTVQRVPGGARKALLQRRVVQLGSLTARRDRLLEPDAMALVSRGPGDLKAGQRALGTLAQWEGPPALRGTNSKKSATYTNFQNFYPPQGWQGARYGNGPLGAGEPK